MNFLEDILGRLQRVPGRVVLEEMRAEGRISVTAGELRARIATARAFLAGAGLQKGDRCALLAPNSIAWAAIDLAAMADGIIVVPLYTRQAPAELAAMLCNCQPRLVCCGDATLRDALLGAWPEAPRCVLAEEVLAAPANARAPVALAPDDPVTIIYTSGTSGEAKGVVLTAGNVTHMLRCTTERLDEMMGARNVPDEVFHYLPFCFAGSWILLLSCLSRSSVLRLSTDLTRLADEMREAAPDYCLNVPALLERMRGAVQGQLAKRGGPAETIFRKARASAGKGIWGALGRWLVFPAIRRKLGPNLKALICGSAPLSIETQTFFTMLGIPVLQVYGLTETTAICTMDHPSRLEPGTVGAAIPDVEMRLGDNDELLVRGPNVFPGYWNRSEETARALAGGWLHTGDQAEQTPTGNWRIIGRLKNLIILNSGHNVAPEPLEEALLRATPGAQQVVLAGNRRSYLSALIFGEAQGERVQAEIDRINAGLPHYRQIRAFHIEPRPLTIESGLLTANGKLRRDAIHAQFREAIEAMYEKKNA